MIAFVQGQIIERSEDGCVVNVNGVGYDLSCSQNTLDDSLASDEARFFVHTSVREDAITLFGFSTQTEKAMFLSLLKVNGVGPKMAIKILSGASMNELSRMIEMGDVKALSNLPKVGKKTAEQLILTLKGKLVLSQDEPKAPKTKIQLALAPKFEGTRADILSALVNLGFRPQDAERVVGDMAEDVEVQSGIRTGLQVLSGNL